MNEHHFLRVLERMQKQEADRPRGASFGTALATAGMSLTLFFVIATSRFQSAWGLSADFLDSLAKVLAVGFAAVTVALMIRWAVVTWRCRNYRTKTPEELLAAARLEVEEDDERIRVAEQTVRR